MARSAVFVLTRRFLPCAAAVASVCIAGLSRAALIDDLELYYGFENDTVASGGITDGSGNDRDGSGVDKDGSGIGYGFSGDVPAALGSGTSLDLAGTTDFLISDTPGYNGVTGTSDRTVAMWVKLNALTQATTLMEWGQNTNGLRWAFRVNGAPTNGTVGGLRIEVAGDFIIGSDAIDDGDWHHVAATFTNDGSPVVEDVKLYVDGALQTTFTSGGGSPAINTSAANEVTFGGSQILVNDDRSVNGLMDEVGIWSRVLSDQEIADLAAGTPIPEPSSLVLLGLGGACVLRRRRP